MTCVPPETPAHSTFTVTFDGSKVNVSPTNHGTMKTSKTFYLVIPDGSATFPKPAGEAIVFNPDPSPDGVFHPRWVSACCIEVGDTPKGGEKIHYGFKVCVEANGRTYCSSDPTIVNDPEDA